MTNSNQAIAAGRRGILARIVRDRYLLLMLAPCIAFILLFRYVPMYGLVLAFRRFDIASPFGGQWVGLRYFQAFFNSGYSWQIIGNTFMLNLYSVLFAFPAPIVFALLLNEVGNKGFQRVVQVISYIPYFISIVVIASILYLILSPSTGFVNRVISAMGAKPIYFFAEPRWFRPIFIISDIWQGVGWGSIIYMAAMSGIGTELYEAAVIDGAGKWRQMYHVTLTGIRSTIVILLIIRLGGMFSSATEKVLLLYSPLTYERADVLGTYLYRTGLFDQAYSLATAIGLANSLVSLLLIAGANAISRRLTDTALW
jgi:putative aldouronate transport system permease protein